MRRDSGERPTAGIAERRKQIQFILRALPYSVRRSSSKIKVKVVDVEYLNKN